MHTPYAAQAVNLGSPSDQKEASAGKEEEPTEAYQQGRKVVATKRNDHTIKTGKTWAKGKARPEAGNCRRVGCRKLGFAVTTYFSGCVVTACWCHP